MVVQFCSGGLSGYRLGVGVIRFTNGWDVTLPYRTLPYRTVTFPYRTASYLTLHSARQVGNLHGKRAIRIGGWTSHLWAATPRLRYGFKRRSSVWLL